jgi:ribosome biogenesis GTPase
LTKADLSPDFEATVADVRQAVPDIPVHAISSHTGYGLPELAQYLRPGKTVVFLGMSGVGKSSLLNALMEENVMEVRDIREDDSRGRHTTTHRQLFMLPSGTYERAAGETDGRQSGAMVIDTPGMRELGLLGADEGIREGFADVEEIFSRCRFSNCRHQTEPGCAILAALGDGSLHHEHWARYLSQRKENKFADDKAGFLRDKRAQHKSLAMWSKQEKKKGKIRK